MPPQQPGESVSSWLCQIQLMNTVRFTAGANSTVAKSLVHARAVTHRGSVQLRTARSTAVSEIGWNMERASPPLRQAAIGDPTPRAHDSRSTLHARVAPLFMTR